MRTYHLIEGQVKYVKHHEFPNHSKRMSTPVVHGRLDCWWLIGKILGCIWKYTGYKLTRDQQA